MSDLRPFWRYYGGKWRAAPHYPKPEYDIIIEPFAGSAGYSLRYPDRIVILIEKYHVIAELWRFLIDSTYDDILSIPCVESVYDLPKSLPDGARYLVGFCLNDATVSPARVLSAGKKRLALMGRHYEGWNENRRRRVAEQVGSIKHWYVVEGDYSDAPDVKATWFVDPPYNNRVGQMYVHSSIDYAKLSEWCRCRSGQVIVCENEGADWLPFKPFRKFKTVMNRQGSREVVFLS